MQRRHLLQALMPALLAPGAFAQTTSAAAGEPVHRLLAAWREAGSEAVDRCGIVEVDWAAGRVRIPVATAMPGRAHGLQTMPDGGWVVVANRPGHWLLRVDAEGRVATRHRVADDQPLRTFNGHVQPDATGRWLYTTETDPADGSGWVSVRDAATLARVAQFPTGGVDPHQVLPDREGRLLVAVGGIPRDLAGKRIDLARMAPSLVHLDPSNGRELGRWTVADPRLSIRHLAWSAGAQPLLGVALQAEHADAAARRAAPLLAVWDGESLQVLPGALADGYAGDLAAGPGGGFVVSAQKQGQGLWWHPHAQDQLVRVAELTDPCAVATWDQGRGVLMAGARGVARWHVRHAPRMLAWPRPMAPDNHWVLQA
ncbi:DUF1513 domain-containing protein [Ramlibacter sp.]|uniref:DUF1513 domain-containing protein n=1 Tax=Ramlibacter sp. TaxID=1917967 RepID=UPI0035AE232D